MNGFRSGALLALVTLLLLGSAETILAAEVSRHPDRCRILANTGKSEAGRDPESRSTCARVDNRPPRHHVGHPKKKHERPIDRLRSRGEGRPKATGDKGARRQFHKHSHARGSHARHYHWRR
jgi:hypothetical protein